MNNAGNWMFDDKIAPIFDEHVRQHIPLYDEIHISIQQLANWFIEENTNVYDIGTSTGSLIVDLYKNTARNNVSYIGIDTSKEMIDIASQNLKKNNVDALVLQQDVMNDSFKIENASFVASILTNQFIKIEQRQSLINKIYKGLNAGSAYIVVEKVVGNNAKFNEMWVEMYHEAKLRNGLSEKEVIAKARSIRGILKPLSIKENTNLLKNAGFKEVDMFFKWCNFAGFIAVK